MIKSRAKHKINSFFISSPFYVDIRMRVIE
jgi:hypothetical protein